MSTPRATRGNVLLRPDWEFGQHQGLIEVPATAESRHRARVPCVGTVVSMSGAPVTKKGVPYDPEFRPGNVVLIKEYSGEFLDWEGERFVKAPIHAVLATIENQRMPPE